jgi:hypothetical protein
MSKGIDVSRYVKAPRKAERLNERHALPITEKTKLRIEQLSPTVKINDALRDFLEELLTAAESESSRVA